MNKKVLIIAVHPDDETLGCGGTILKHKANSDEIYWLVLTKMQGDNYSLKNIQEREKLVQNITVMYGFNKMFWLNYPTQRMHIIDLRDIIKSIEKVFDEVKPDIIYTMFAHDVHSDHRVAFDAVYSCTKSFRKPYINSIYMMETLSETEFAPSIPSITFVPNVYVDITPYMDKKLEIMKMYDTEIMQEPYPRSLSSIEALARVRGSRCGVRYAEAFMLLYEKK